jgi:hypothetical protein
MKTVSVAADDDACVLCIHTHAYISRRLMNRRERYRKRWMGRGEGG